MSPARAPVAMVAVRPEQGPPLSVPVSFFLVGPVALVAAGAFVALRQDDGIATVWAPSNVALVHLGVAGLLLFTMTGALYQMLPVVAGAVVPLVRLAHVVHACLVAGVAALVWGQATGSGAAFGTATVALLAGLGLFLGPALWAVWRSPVKGPTAWGMRLALAGLVAVAWAGLTLARVRGGAAFEGDWLTLRWAHAHLGFLGWVGALVAAVSWQVLPMFFFVQSPPRAVAWGVTGGVLVSVAALVTVAALGLPSSSVRFAALPGALAVWAVHPAWALWALAHRRRKRPDATLWGWWLALGAAPVCLGLGAATVLFDAPGWGVAYGLLVVWGWAGALVHGMLTRIVPFLVWLHWCAPRVAQWRMRSAKELLTDAEVRVGVGLHGASLVAGAVAVLTGASWAWRAFGAGLALTGLAIALEVAVTLWRGRTPLGPRAPAGTVAPQA